MLTGNNLANAASNKSKRVAGDFYATPPEATDALLKELTIPKHRIIWEPACGNGAITNVLIRNGYGTVSSDIHPRMVAIEVDFLSVMAPNGHWIITNPPFSLAEDFISHAFRLFDYGLEGFAMLLKSQYWHSSRRRRLFLETKPWAVLPLTWRPDFLNGDRGGSPTMDCLWTVWRNGHYGDCRYMPLCRS